MQYWRQNMPKQCLCGSERYKAENRKGYITNTKGGSDRHDIPVGICDSCGLIRQIDLPFETEKEYGEFYTKKYPPNYKEYNPRTYKSDIASCENRFKKFGLSGAKKLLDLGCGSGSLVAVCRKKGIESYGCELVKYHYAPDNPYVYYKKFEDIHFPTDCFDTIVCCDVIEHVLNPLKFLEEMHRITTQNGFCYIEFPLFFDPNGGEGHWKRYEHLWYFTPDQLKEMLIKTGFEFDRAIDTGKTKLLFVVKKPTQTRIKLLLPPGIGDVYWPLVKTESFLKREGIKPPVDAYVAAPRSKKHDSHLRAFPFLKMFPFLHSTDQCLFNKNDAIWKEAYLQQGRSIFKDILGCDYFITWNGYLRAGKSLESIDPEIKCNWFLPRFISLKEEAYKKSSIAAFGKYIVLYWVFRGSNSLLLRKYPIGQLASMVNTVIAETGLIPILVGAEWDLEDRALETFKQLLPKNTIDLRGKTTLEEAFGLIRGAQAIMGIPSGITIMGAVFGIKTVLLYSEFFTTNGVHKNFRWNVFPPSIRKTTYYGELVNKTTPIAIASRMISLISGSTYSATGKGLTMVKNKGEITLPETKAMPITDEGYSSIRDITGEKRNKITFICVLKSGGYFGPIDVKRLKYMIDNHTKIGYDFVCITDMVDVLAEIKTIRLQHKHNGLGWWSKIELFKPGLVNTSRIIYLDLDTILLGSLDFIMNLDDNFIALEPWNRANRKDGQCASGMMSWINNGAYNFIYNTFPWNKVEQMNFGDQQYITQRMKENNKRFTFFQRVVSGIYSYKRNCRNGLPQNAKIICFHGRPRPANTGLDWVRKAYGEL